MSNDYFQFKKFRIDQTESVMRVTTEACILGAFLPCVGGPVLDIGTGTGLLPLMLVQHCPCRIDAVERDSPSAREAEKNIRLAGFQHQIRIIEEDVIDFVRGDPGPYPFIVSNPPFYRNSLIGKDQRKNKALHEHTLTQQTLLDITLQLMTSDGQLMVLYPPREADEFIHLAQLNGLHLVQCISIYNLPGSPLFRRVLTFQGAPSSCQNRTLVIRDTSEDYSKDFRNLLKPYYLHF